MKTKRIQSILRSIAGNLLAGLNGFILFFILFENRIEIPAAVLVAGRLHPLILHFPIVLLVLAFVFEFFREEMPLERNSLRWLIRALYFTGALTAALTTAFGLLLSKEDGYSGDLIQLHKWTGTAVSILAYLIWVFYERLPTHILRILMAVLVFILLAAGHFGASITHGEDFFWEPLNSASQPAPDLVNGLVYNDLVVPVLKSRCYSCHNPDRAKGGLVMTDTVSLLAGGENGEFLIRGNSEGSLAVERMLLDINHKHRMPPKGKAQLTENQIALIRGWIDEGGSFSSRLSDSTVSAQTRQLAYAIYGSSSGDIFDFSAADASVIKQLNNSYRLVTPIAPESPALDVSFFGRSSFDQTSLNELEKIREQVINLNLSGMPVGEEELSFIAGFPNLRKLNLNYTGVSDAGIQRLKGMKNLKVLMLSGTDISKTGLTELRELPRLRNVYAGDTRVTFADAFELMQANSKIIIEAGAATRDTTKLALSQLVLEPGNTFFREPFQLSFTHPIRDTRIFYTSDGADPDSTQGMLYNSPVKITSNTIIKAKAYKKGWADSQVTEKHYQQSAYKPDSVSLVNSPDTRHKGKGSMTLFDLKEGSTDILYASDGNWLGYRAHDFVTDLFFDKPVDLKEVILSTLVSTNLEAFPPTLVEVWKTESGNSVRLAQTVPFAPEKGNQIRRNMIVLTLDNGRSLTQLRIIAKPLHKLPSWHSKAGSPAWFMIDEVVLR